MGLTQGASGANTCFEGVVIVRSFILAISTTAMVLPALAVTATPAASFQYYDRDGYYDGPCWRGRDGRWNPRCHRRHNTNGLLVGGAQGALVGRSVDHGRNRATGTIVGAAAGAPVGREVERSSERRRRH